MPYVTTSDGVQLYYTDQGTGQPVFFSHGWPLCSDASIKLVKDGTLKVYPGAPHGIYGAYQDALDKDMLAFIKA